MAKSKVAPPFTQITATSWTGSNELYNRTVQPVIGTVLYGLDKKGRVWRKLGSAYCPHWHLLPNEAGVHPEREEE